MLNTNMTRIGKKNEQRTKTSIPNTVSNPVVTAVLLKPHPLPQATPLFAHVSNKCSADD